MKAKATNQPGKFEALKEEAKATNQYLFRVYSRGRVWDYALLPNEEDVTAAIGVWLGTPTFSGLILSNKPDGSLHERIEVFNV